MFPVSRSEALSRSHFHALLRDWYEDGYDGDTVGDSGSHGQRAWIWIRHLGSRYHLNGDSTHEAVGDYLDLLDTYGEALAWSVVESSRGGPNRVVFGPERRAVPGFSLYRAEPA